MADNGSAQSASTQAFPFKVSISNVGDISCSEVSGLETEYDEIVWQKGKMAATDLLAFNF